MSLPNSTSFIFPNEKEKRFSLDIFPLLLMNESNKPQCFSLAGLSSQVQCLRIRQVSTQVVQPSSSLLWQALGIT
jgi:hypothetical protein